MGTVLIIYDFRMLIVGYLGYGIFGMDIVFFGNTGAFHTVITE